MIPKIIHQIWIGPNKKPDLWMDTWKKAVEERDDWEYILWNEEKIKTLNLYNEDLYKNEKDYACKADILRYEILYTYGGCYIDADMVLLNDNFFNFIENNNNNEFLIAKEPNKELIANSFIACTTNNKLMKIIIYECRRKYIQYRKNYYPYQVTGPYLITPILKQYHINPLPSILFYPIQWNNIKDPELHKKQKFPYSFTLQYGYTTNDFKKILT